MKKLFFALMAILIISCSGGNSSQTTPLQNPASVEPETTKAATSTPKPTLKASSTAALLDYYELPEWMKNPATNIATALVSNESQNKREVTFFNAESGEKYAIEIPQKIGGYFWYDNLNFGFLSSDLKTSLRLNLSNGKLSEESNSPESIRLLDPDWIGWLNGFKTVKEEPSSQNVTFTSTRMPYYSKNTTYTADKKPDWDGLTITNNLTHEMILDLTTPTDTYITVYAWSPTQDNVMAYVQGKYAFPTDMISKDMTLNIIDVENGKTLKTYSGDFGRLHWSPDGEKILFQDAKSIYGNYGVGFTEAPCIIFLNLDEKRCLRSIPRRVPEGHTLATTGLYEWSYDNMKIYYTYVYYISEGSPWVQGELCIYSLIDGHINCPTSNMEEMVGHGVSYSLSPDEQYIYLCTSESTILNDYAGNSTDGIIKSDGTDYFLWTSTRRNDAPSNLCAGNDLLWRPLP